MHAFEPVAPAAVVVAVEVVVAVVCGCLFQKADKQKNGEGNKQACS